MCGGDAAVVRQAVKSLQPSSSNRVVRENAVAGVAFIFFLLLSATTAPAQATRPAAVRAHDPSTIIKFGDDYWVFCTGPGVRSYRSRDLRHWEPGPRVFDTLPAWTAAFLNGSDRLWAPDIIRAPDGRRYLLYYSASSFGRNTSAIGLATNTTLDPRDWNYCWIDQGVVIQSQRADDYNAIDPALTLDAEGKLWLAFGSFWSGIKLVQLDAATGKPIAPHAPLHALAKHKEIEAPFIYHHADHYYLFVNFGLCCRGVNSTYNIRVGRSVRITGPYLDRDGNDLRDGGGSLVLGSAGTVIGPGHAGILQDHESKKEWLSFHFYDATQNGRGTLAVRPITWDADGWPRVEEAQP
jgi:arabinan endo-1,5-alpha-L-arabinosidase